MKAEIIIKNGIVVIIPEDINDMDKFWDELENYPREKEINCHIVCYNGYENAIEVSLWSQCTVYKDDY